MKEFENKLAEQLKARNPFIYIPTWEEERILSVIKDTVQDEDLIKTKRELFVWKITTGITDEESTRDDSTRDPKKALEFIEEYNKPSIFVLLDYHLNFGSKGHCPSNYDLVVRKLRDLYNIKNSPTPKNVIFVSPSVVIPDELQKNISVLDFDLPSYNEIEKELNEMITFQKEIGRLEVDLTPNEKEKMIKAAVGLTLQEAENAFARAMVDDGRLDETDIDTVLEEKIQIIKKEGILEYVENDVKIEDVGGLENLKKWIKRRNKSWLDSAKKYCLPAPKGVLITGVPGCGKSLVAKSISSMWQLPLLRLDVGRIFGGIVGSSEENMRKAIKFAEAISPCILWIDEVEKGFSGTGSNSDSGTTARVFGTFITWMQEKKKSVFVIATANNINHLPPEFLRKGRFDEVFFVDLPTKKEREDIFKVHLGKRLQNPEVKGSFEITQEVLSNLADMTEGYGGSEIEQIVLTGLYDAFFEDRSLEYEDLTNAIENTIPLSVTQEEQIRMIRNWADTRAVAATAKDDREEYNVDIKKKQKKEKKKDKSDIFRKRGGRVVEF